MKKTITLLLLIGNLSIYAQQYQYPTWADSVDNVSYWKGTTLLDNKTSDPMFNTEYVYYNNVIYVYKIKHDNGRLWVERLIETHDVEWFQNKYPNIAIPKK